MVSTIFSPLRWTLWNIKVSTWSCAYIRDMGHPHIYVTHDFKTTKMRKYEAGSSFIHLPLVLQQAISLQSRILVSLFQSYSAHDWGLEKYEVMLILPETLTSCWSLHPTSRELVHQQFHGTEIILEEHFHFFSKPRWKGDTVRHTAKKFKRIFTITWWQLI